MSTIQHINHSCESRIGHQESSTESEKETSRIEQNRSIRELPVSTQDGRVEIGGKEL